jgi:hypothetical protein
MDYFSIFVLAYFGIYLVMAVPRQMLTVMGFLFRDWLARILVGLFIVFVYSLFNEVPEVADVEPAPTVEISDIMIDDMKEKPLVFPPVYIVGTVEE